MLPNICTLCLLSALLANFLICLCWADGVRGIAEVFGGGTSDSKSSESDIDPRFPRAYASLVVVEVVGVGWQLTGWSFLSVAFDVDSVRSVIIGKLNVKGEASMPSLGISSPSAAFISAIL
jgi:hypothetical protein